MNSVNSRFKTECQLIAVMASMLMFLNSCASESDNQFACEGPKTSVVKNASADRAGDTSVKKRSAVELLKEGERILNSGY
ncbi:MAG: hypothetical protein J5934_01295 [Succinivibrio sp.]|nr:hypothetical protein [Succinivibrio sp.]